MRLIFIIFSLTTLIFACSQQQEKNPNNFFTPKVVEAHGYLVSQDSMSEPIVIPVDESKLTKIPALNPNVIPSGVNVQLAESPKIVLAGTPKACIPGTAPYLFPKIISAIDSPFVAGVPEVVIAKDAYIKDQNPQNFSSFSKLQGLRHDIIRCILQDNGGNLWLGTFGGGVTKYDGKCFTHYTQKEGLSNNYIYSILQDKNGNLWFGTFGEGVSKYDGKCFTRYTEKEGLSNNTVRAILQDKSGNIWFGTLGGGVSKYDGKCFTNYTEKEGLSNDSVYCILQDKSGNLWFGTDGGGVSEYDGKSFTNYTYKEGLSTNTIYCILQDKSGNLWFGTDGGGVSKYDGKCFANYTEKEGLCSNTILSILQDKYGNIWFGASIGGVTKYDGKYFTRYTEKEGLSNNTVFSIIQDKSGNLWFGTLGGGISKYDGKCFTHYTEKEGLSNNGILSIIQDKSGNLWFGTSGGGVCKYDGKSFTNYTEKDGLSTNTVFSMLQDKSGNLWFGTYGGGVCKYDGKYFTHFSKNEGLCNNTVFCIFQDKDGNLWFGSYGGGVSKYDGKSFTNYTEKEGLSNNSVYSIMQDKYGNFWFGTYGGGVSKYDGKYFTHYTEKEGLSNNYVLSILQDKIGNLWFGTSGGGITKYDGNRIEAIERGENIPQQDRQDLKKTNNTFVKCFTHYTEKEGLSNNCVFSMLQDKSGTLWFGTRYGLSKLKTERLKLKIKNPEFPLFKNYGYDDGFLGVGCNGNAIFEDNTGTIWIGANDRLTAYHSEGDDPDTIPPNMQLTCIELFNENIAWVNFESKVKSQKSVLDEAEGSNGIGHKGNNIAVDTSFVLGNGVTVGNFEFDDITKWYNLPENLSLAYNNNYLTFNFIGITQKQSKKVKYQYKLEGIDENWSAITNRTEAPYGNLPHGSYTFKVKAMNSEGFWSNEYNYSFTIRPPWWKTWWFKVFIIFDLLFIIWLYIKWRERKLKKDKLLLEQKVKEQTYELSEKNEELNQQNEEIMTQRDEIEVQRDIATRQKEQIEEIHKEVTDSINYAERIQRSFLATKELLNENLNEHFVFFHPKDVVSGDFYWASKIVSPSGVENFVLVTADSTGHGVPGAIMSILNISSLENAVEQGICEPSEILNKTRKTIIERLKKDGSTEGGKDGMDASLICFDFVNKKFTYAAANNPIWIIRENKLIELSPDKMPVGKHDKDQIPFAQHEFQLQNGDIVYTLTDGLSDQFGGPKGKKFKSAKLKELLLSVNSKTMSDQKQILEKFLQSWKGNLNQVDDITIIGIKI